MLYRQIKGLIGHKILQDDLNELEKQAENGDMRFNAKQMLHFVRQAKILTVLPVKQRNITTSQLKSIFGNYLQWNTHITNILKTANLTLGFLRRNIKYCPTECKRLAYIDLVLSTLQYGAIVWDPCK